jgi:Mrp family chromosome partitioning ATPase
MAKVARNAVGMTRIFDALQINARRQNDSASTAGQVYGEPGILPRDELISLYHTIRTQLPQDARPIVEITSSSRGEGTSTLARDLSNAVASTLGLRVLLVLVETTEGVEAGLGAVAAGRSNVVDVITPARDGPFYRTSLAMSGSAARYLFDSGGLDRVFGEALELVDVIFIDAPPILSEVASLVLTHCAGGVVLVVEAERTRAPIVEQARRAIESNNGRLLGVVMNKRRYHIPRAIYRQL